jgi:hypothetical protein
LLTLTKISFNRLNSYKTQFIGNVGHTKYEQEREQGQKKAAMATAKELSDKEAEIASRLSNRQRLTVIIAILISWLSFLSFAFSTVVVCRDFSGVLAVFTWTLYVGLATVFIGFPSALLSCYSLCDALRGNRSALVEPIIDLLPRYLKISTSRENDSNQALEHQFGTCLSSDGPLKKAKGLSAEKLLIYLCAALIVIVVIMGIAVAPLPIPIRIWLFLSTVWLMAMHHSLLASFCGIRNELQIETTIDHVVATSLSNIALITIGFGIVYFLTKHGGQEIARLAIVFIPLSTTVSGWLWTRRILKVTHTLDEAFFSMSAVGNIPTLTICMPLLFLYLYVTEASL